MTEAAKRCRRWPWIVPGIALLVVAGLVAWRFRPLNAAERALVGVWLADDAVMHFHFSSDRKFKVEWQGPKSPSDMFPAGIGIGTWSASADQIVIRSPSPTLSQVLRFDARWPVRDYLTGGRAKALEYRVRSPEKLMVESHRFSRFPN